MKVYSVIVNCDITTFICIGTTGKAEFVEI